MQLCWAIFLRVRLRLTAPAAPFSNYRPQQLMAFANDFAQTLKQQADIVRIVGGYISLRKSGAQNYSGLCPFHKEKSPSFSVHAVRQFYHCFGCQASGAVI